MSSRVAPTDVPNSELPALPADEEVDFYATHGWYLTRRLFTDDEVDALQQASERYYAGHRYRCYRGAHRALRAGRRGTATCSGTTTTFTTRARPSRRCCVSRWSVRSPRACRELGRSASSRPP